VNFQRFFLSLVFSRSSDTRTNFRQRTLRRLLLILVDNAVKYTPSAGIVGMALQRNGTHAEIRVSDTGIGISESDLPHVFDRFYRADKARSRELGGTGLGLSIGRWIANAHSGDVQVESHTKRNNFSRLLAPCGMTNSNP
jgi:signal transduction histidine kinase